MDERITRWERLEGDACSWMMWVKIQRCRVREQVLLAENGARDDYRLAVQRAYGLLRFSARNLGDFSCCLVDDGNWHHVAIVLGKGRLRFYRDGMEMMGYDAPGGMLGTQGTPVIGAEENGACGLCGEIRDIRIENRACPAEEIDALCRQTRPAEIERPTEDRNPPAPLYEDPLYNSAKDGMVIFDPLSRRWWFLYMQIRNGWDEPGVAVHHGTTIGAASSPDGIHWTYRGILQGLEERPGANTFWAPDVVFHEGRFHGYFSYVKGIQRGWFGDRTIRHYISRDLLHWEYAGDLEGLGSRRCLDSCVYPLPDGRWGLWYKDEVANQTGFAVGEDLDHFEPVGSFDPDAPPVEGCDVFQWNGYYWLMGDDCYAYNGLRVYRSEDAFHWKRCANILDMPGRRPFDQNVAHHPEVVVHPESGEAYIFYWVLRDACLPHPSHEVCVLQAARLHFSGGQIVCDRDEAFSLRLPGIRPAL